MYYDYSCAYGVWTFTLRVTRRSLSSRLYIADDTNFSMEAIETINETGLAILTSNFCNGDLIWYLSFQLVSKIQQ